MVATTILGMAVAILCLAPPDSNLFWGVNGFRSVAIEVRIGLALAAAAASAIPLLGSRFWEWAGLGLIVAITVAWPLAEAQHFLGDTETRIRSMLAFRESLTRFSLAEWANRLDAQPIDLVVGFLFPAWLGRLGLNLVSVISVLSAIGCAVFLAGTWRLAGRLTDSKAPRVAIAAALAIAGTLEVYAAHAESTGTMLAVVVWFWAELLAPIDRHRQVFRVLALGVAMLLTDRLGLVLLVPMLWRALGTPWPTDQPAPRRTLAIGTVAVALGGVTLVAIVAGGQLGRDWADLIDTALFRNGNSPLAPHDALNLLFLVAPLAFLLPAFAGGQAMSAWWRSPLGRTLLVALIPLLPLVWLLPAAPNGLGAHRDWGLAALPGFTLTLAAVSLLVLRPEPMRTRALRAALPVLVLSAGSWLAVNADEMAVARRALAMVSSPPMPHANHRSAIHAYLGQRGLDLGRPQVSGPHFERAFDLVRYGRLAVQSAEAYAVSGDSASAERMLARMRAESQLTPQMEASARLIESMLRTPAAADTAR